MRDVLRVLARESGQGLVLGAILGALGLARAAFGGVGSQIAVVVASTLLLVVIAGTVVGAMLPLFLRRVGVDPAIASSPFVASLVDVTGLLIYFNVARAVLDLA
jgi:magnesium transporter